MSDNKEYNTKLVTIVGVLYKGLKNQKEIIFKQNKGRSGVYK